MKTREPDFSQLLKVMRREKPDRPVLFELFLDPRLFTLFSGEPFEYGGDPREEMRILIKAYAAAGYDYTSVYANGFSFPGPEREHAKSTSMRDGLIKDRESFDKYVWPDPENADYELFHEAKKWLPDGMKFMIRGPGGQLENMQNIVGYDNICAMLYDDPDLLEEIAANVGTRLVKYYEICASCDTIGILMDNDDWGFNTQTFLSPADMRKYIFPWHKKIAEIAHRHNMPVALHSCGNPLEVMDDIITDIKIDARHSYEDKIIPVEEFYKRFHDHIAVLGGMDVDMMTRGTPEQIYKRSKTMLEAAPTGYALGTGNSIAAYIPIENYMAMRKAAMGE
ncbi:MAG TPA: uroporphyrinogen decarboxylase family protein [Oscillospiraceae bacterium]|nr:uroporphyrinogen decarboxylase family protein [Oscillospiraceae bacterium]HPS35388.1 uroporphyrinogen decarboxylase family protein [Oscillospiraceae bacterium]